MNLPLAIHPGSSSEVETFLRPESWVELAPNLHVASPQQMGDISAFGLPDAATQSLEDLLLREGYFHIPQLPWQLPLADMAQAIVRLTEQGLVPPFCFMYDEFWLLFYRLHQMLGRFLGTEYAFLPEFWAWFVDPRAGHSGWKPHRDKNFEALFPDGRPKSLTVWIPLTDATPLNGCIYIVPAHLDPTYNTDQDKDWRFEAQDIRALPSPAGGLLVWNSGVVHWGSRSSPLAAGPRISVAFEFQRGDVPPMNRPLLKPLTFLNANQRLALVCKQILQYQHMYPLAPDLQKFAEAVMKQVPKESAS